MRDATELGSRREQPGNYIDLDDASTGPSWGYVFYLQARSRRDACGAIASDPKLSRRARWRTYRAEELDAI